MKKILNVLVGVFLLFTTQAQTTTGALKNQKDIWGTSYNYTGEIKNGKPNGFGVAVYNNGYVLKFAGQFQNGVANGKGTMLKNNGVFLTGDWKDGKLNGKSANVNKEGVFYVGDMKDGLREGKGWMVLQSNAFYVGEFKNDTYDGMGIYGWENANILAQNTYLAGKRNGPGIEYEVDSDKIFEGTWKDGKWESASTIPFKSFMKANGFKGSASPAQVLIGPRDANKTAIDTTFFYSKEKKKRYFGFYVAGYIKSGLQCVDDKSRFIGGFGEGGGNGYSYDYKINDSYSEGIYSKGKLNGAGIIINLRDSSIYKGEFQNGTATGKGIFVNNLNTIYDGEYVNGSFTGNGRIINTNGKIKTGTFQDGNLVKLTGLTMPDGKFYNPSPATFSEALNNVINNYPDDFADVIGDLQNGNYEGFLHFPGDSNPFSTTNYSKSKYQSTLAENQDEETAERMYKDFAQKILSTTIKGVTSNALKLTGTVMVHLTGENETRSDFTLDKNSNYKYTDMKVALMMQKSKTNNKYSIIIIVGDFEKKKTTPYYVKNMGLLKSGNLLPI